MAIAFARPILSTSTLLRSLTTLKTTATAPPTQAATIVRPLNPFSAVLPRLFYGEPPVKPVAIVTKVSEPVAPAPVPVKPAGCSTCKTVAAVTAAPSLQVGASAPAPTAAPAPTPTPTAAAPTAEAPKPSAVGLGVGLVLVVVLLAAASYYRPR